jgi:hypothetical protein
VARPYRRLFLVRPNAWALLTGGLAGASINLLTGSIPSASAARQSCVTTAALSLMIAAIALGWLSIKLEDIREDAKGEQWRLEGFIRDCEKRLVGATATSIAFLFLGLLRLFLC